MKNVSFRRNGVEFEPTKQELKIVLDDFAKRLAERDSHIADLSKKVKELEDELAEKEKAKTYFAIEQLEKVKWLVEDIDYDFGDDNNISRDFVIKKINQQIKELKGE